MKIVESLIRPRGIVATVLRRYGQRGSVETAKHTGRPSKMSPRVGKAYNRQPEGNGKIGRSEREWLGQGMRRQTPLITYGRL